MLPVFDTKTAQGKSGLEATLARLRASSSIDSQWHQAAAQWIQAVRERGDNAVVEQMRRFTDPNYTADRIRLPSDDLMTAHQALDPALRSAIERAIEHVRQYQEHIRPKDARPITIDGAELGLRWTPIEPVGLLVPGGAAVLFSTLIMLAVPAIVAGVDPAQISVASPPPTIPAPLLEDSLRSGVKQTAFHDISPITLAVCHMLGIQRVYRIGGAAGAAALALGTDRVEPVNFLAGPGHPVVQSAKLQLQGIVGTDGFYGASEIVSIVDDTADPKRVASDLLAQAEHGPGKCFMISWSADVIDSVQREVATQVKQRIRREVIEKALRDESCAVLVGDEEEAVRLADRFAAEHVNLAVADPDALLAKLKHGGEYFLGDATPVAAGDYYAGPSHTLPTGTTARFSSGVSVHTFLKRSGTVAYRNGMPNQAMDDIALLAEAEGLDAHVASIHARR